MTAMIAGTAFGGFEIYKTMSAAGRAALVIFTLGIVPTAVSAQSALAAQHSPVTIDLSALDQVGHSPAMPKIGSRLRPSPVSVDLSVLEITDNPPIAAPPVIQPTPIIPSTPVESKWPVSSRPDIYATSAPAVGQRQNQPQGLPSLGLSRLWGMVGVQFDGSGDRISPNGTSSDPIFAVDSVFKYGLTDSRSAYLFSESRIWIELSNSISTKNGLSPRELDLDIGGAWNVWRDIELRASAYAFSNIDRGISTTKPFGFKDGVKVEARYLFPSYRTFDTGRSNFIGLGYLPTKELVGGDGVGFKPGLFTHIHVTQEIPFFSFPAYAYADLQAQAAAPATPRLFSGDFGLAIRPFCPGRHVELRLGYGRNDDVKTATSTNLAYGGLRYVFGAAPDGRDVPDDSFMPDVWGSFDLPLYAAGRHIAPNGAFFDPLFSLSAKFNLGLLPDQKLYLFWTGDFWAQRAAPGITNASQGKFDFSKREFDNDFGFAANFDRLIEARVSIYALDNLNRGTTLDKASGEAWGAQLEARHYFSTSNAYDPERRTFLSIGYTPVGDMISPNGDEFNAGLFARGQATIDIPLGSRPLYGFGMVTATAQKTVTPRLLDIDLGIAWRPFQEHQRIEFRTAYQRTHDLKGPIDQDLIYGAVRALY
jgi:hypothetical protein